MSRPTGSVPSRKTWPPTGCSDGGAQRRVAVLLGSANSGAIDVGEQRAAAPAATITRQADDGAAVAPEVAPELAQPATAARWLGDGSRGTSACGAVGAHRRAGSAD